MVTEESFSSSSSLSSSLSSRKSAALSAWPNVSFLGILRLLSCLAAEAGATLSLLEEESSAASSRATAAPPLTVAPFDSFFFLCSSHLLRSLFLFWKSLSTCVPWRQSSLISVTESSSVEMLERKEMAATRRRERSMDERVDIAEKLSRKHYKTK